MVEPIKAIWAEVREDPWIRCSVDHRHRRPALLAPAPISAPSPSRAASRPGRARSAEEVHWSPRQNGVWKPTVTARSTGMVAGAGLHFVVDADIVVAAEHGRSSSTPTSTSGWSARSRTSGSPSACRSGSALRMTLCGKNVPHAGRAGLPARARRRGRAGRQADGDGRGDRRTRSPPTRPAAVQLSMQACGASLEMPLHAGDGVRLGAAADALGPPRLQGRADGRSPRSATRCGTRSRREARPPETSVMNPTLAPEEEAFRQRGRGVPRRARRRSTAFFWHEGEHDAADAPAVPRRSASAAGCRSPGRSRSAGVGCHRCTSSSSGTRWRTPAPPGRRSGRGSSPRRSSPTARTSRAALPARAARRHDLLLPRVLRAGGRVRPRRRAHAGRAATVTVRRSTARSVGPRAAIAPTTCGCCAAPARSRATVAGADAADRRPALAGHLDLADPVARRRALQRGPLRRRRGAGRQPRRRGGRSLDADGRVAGDRAPRAVQPASGSSATSRSSWRSSGARASPTTRSCATDSPIWRSRWPRSRRCRSLMLRRRSSTGDAGVVEAACNKLAGSEAGAAHRPRRGRAGRRRGARCAAADRVPVASVDVGDDRRRHVGGDARLGRPPRSRLGADEDEAMRTNRLGRMDGGTDDVRGQGGRGHRWRRGLGGRTPSVSPRTAGRVVIADCRRRRWPRRRRDRHRRPPGRCRSTPTSTTPAATAAMPRQRSTPSGASTCSSTTPASGATTRSAPLLDVDPDYWDFVMGGQRPRPAALHAGGGADDGRPGSRAGSSTSRRSAPTWCRACTGCRSWRSTSSRTRSPRSSATAGITVNAVAPGPIDNEASRRQVPPAAMDRLRDGTIVKRLGDADDIYGMIAYLASDDAAWVTGQTLHGQRRLQPQALIRTGHDRGDRRRGGRRRARRARRASTCSASSACTTCRSSTPSTARRRSRLVAGPARAGGGALRRRLCPRDRPARGRDHEHRAGRGQRDGRRCSRPTTPRRGC